jgi:hypothetical protein
MATVTKTWVFASNVEGLVEVGDMAGTNFSYNATDGSPSNGSIVFGGIDSGNKERARTGTGVTWETWGVPSSSVVQSVQVTSWMAKGLGGGSTNGVTRMRIVNSSNTTVHSAGDLVDKTHKVTAWTTYTDGASRAVDASYQASTTAVKMELEVNPCMYYDFGKGDFGYQTRLDTIELTITYTAASSGIVPILMSLFRRWRN